MIRKVPLVPTILVTLAVLIMIGLGVWQLDRARWKDRMIEQYRTASRMPPIAFPTAPLAVDPPLFRWATGFCMRPVSKRATAGQNRSGESGYVHVVNCSTGAEGPGMAVEIGWSKDPQAKWKWDGGPVTGMIAPDRQHRIRLVAASSPPGLQPARLPSLESIPRNHRIYAATWFLFALAAVVIYVLALRKRLRAE